ncbi:MAG: gamma-glutamyl-gamma-aminobutyrate hydrolase family protein [candidate division WOR-3 bacterium]|nr:gamma-glutamyl-gamma-aminobutyrate hydrolase family protein [candidate division WOR-3 bacterium]MCX7947982.1 gamma-glutamyl-gamma-aminobutyrate hydrolase family protein [candidate division WOR-3 bacterium]MDW8150926.1 gamma-glutamyl-gamma-aminobutyrate hydrolase family protein [candidate division WOR-3 bacterium]
MDKFVIVSPRSYPYENYIRYLHDIAEIKFIPDEIGEIHPRKYKGLILIGGEDVHPKFYNEENLYSEIDEERDIIEFEILDKFVNYQRMVFGICRGLQVINVFFKGSLYQDIPKQLNSYIHKYYEDKTPKQVEVFNNDTYHKVKIISENPFFKEIEFIVNSRHHQAIKDLAKDFYAFAISEDGIIEAIAHKKLLIFAVQWHPERVKSEYNKISKRILQVLSTYD